jgi:hypothetical protein
MSGYVALVGLGEDALLHRDECVHVSQKTAERRKAQHNQATAHYTKVAS